MEDKLLKIINHYGVNNQLRQFNEECFELIEAIIDYRYVEVYEGSPAEKFHKEHVAEEIADVMVMLEQFKLYYDISSEEITNIFWSKVDRQLDRMKEEK
jgi:NTP pyrophosphatase (non-canonical NTP hydrolase)